MKAHAAHSPQSAMKSLARSHSQESHFRMRSERKAVPPAVDRVLLAVKEATLDQEQLDDLAVALAEALSNAAIHGNGLRSRRMVQINVTVTPGRAACVEVKDSGPGFDRGSLCDPTEERRVLEPSGRGVFLMQRLVDKLEFNKCGNAVRLLMIARRPKRVNSNGRGEARARS